MARPLLRLYRYSLLDVYVTIHNDVYVIIHYLICHYLLFDVMSLLINWYYIIIYHLMLCRYSLIDIISFFITWCLCHYSLLDVYVTIHYFMFMSLFITWCICHYSLLDVMSLFITWCYVLIHYLMISMSYRQLHTPTWFSVWPSFKSCQDSVHNNNIWGGKRCEQVIELIRNQSNKV